MHDLPRGARRPVTIVRQPPPSPLVERAVDYLRAGPAPAVELIAHVCQMSGLPAVVAEEMANALFAPHRALLREPAGRWALAPDTSVTLPRSSATTTLTPMPAGTSAPTLPSNASPGSAAAIDMALTQGANHGAGQLRRLSHLPWVVVDVETTGGRAEGGDRITEVAAVIVRDGVVCEVFETLVNPERPIPPWITALTNISWSMVRDAPTFREIAPRLLELLEGRIFVAHNATFDWNFICAEVQRATGERLAGERLCTVRLARRLLPQLRRRSLDWVCNHYGVENASRHRAAGDAIATAHVLLRLLHDASGRGIGSWDELRALLDARTSRARRRRPSAMPAPVDKDTTA